MNNQTIAVRMYVQKNRGNAAGRIPIFARIILGGKSAAPGGTSGKEPACQCRRHKRAGVIPGLGRSPGERNGNPLQYSCLENPHGQRSLA